MKRLAAGLLLLASACSTGSGGGQGFGPGEYGGKGPMMYASPGRIVAAEVAFQLLAQRKGQWTAFRETAAEGAIMFVPQPVDARSWLKRQADPGRSITWQPHQVWMSCDGSLAVTHGAWQQPDGTVGYFTTVWQRQKDGNYKWMLDQGDELASALPAPDMIGTSVAACEPPAPASVPVAPGSAQTRGGTSDDKTLGWAVSVDPQCGRLVTVSMYRGAGRIETVFERRVAPPRGGDARPAAGCGAPS